MAEAVHLAPYGVRVTQNQPFVLRCLCQPVQGCLCGSTNSSALHLSVLSLNEAEDQVQNGTVAALLFFDVHAARGRKGFVILVHRLGNRTITYKHPIKPRKVDVDLRGIASADMHGKSNIVCVSKSDFRLINKASKHLLPQLDKLQKDTQTHERYLDPEVSDVAAVYMQQSDTLLAACDQGLTAIVKMQHGVRQGTISVSLAKAQMQLSVLHADGTHDVCAVASIPQAFAILLDTGVGKKALLSAKTILKMNTIHPTDVQPTQTLVTSTSANSQLQQQAMLELLQLCRSKERYDAVLLAECISQGGLEALVDKVCDSSTDNAQLAQKLYDVLVLTLETLPDTADILQRLLLALQKALQDGSSSLILAQLVVNLMQLPIVRKAARLASFVHFLASYLTLQQVASKQFKPSSIAAAKPAVQTWNFREYLPGSKDKYNMASQVQQSQGSWSEGEPIELSGLADVDWQSKQRQAQQDTAAIQKKIAVARSMLYLTPLLREEPVSMPLVANALVHEVMSSMTARSGADQQHDTELRVLCLVSLLGLAARRPSIVDVMSIEMHSDLTLPNADELSGHALLSHIAAGLLRSQSLPQDALGLYQCLQLLAHYAQVACNPQQSLILNTTCAVAMLHGLELLLSSGPPDTWTHMVSLAFAKLLGLQTVFLTKARRVGSARILLRYLLGDDRLMHTSRAFAIYQLTCHPEDAAALAVLELYTALARVLQACPACGVADQALLPLPAQLYQYTEPQSEEDILTCVDNIPQKQQGGAHVEASHRTVTRGQAVQLFDFLIHPVTGLLTSLQASTCSSYSLDLQQKAVELMTAVYSIACSPCLVDPDCCQLCCQGHWAAFNAAYAAEELTASCLHLGALQAMAKHKAGPLQQLLREQNVVGFLLQEFDSEAELQPAAAGSPSSTAVTANHPAPPVSRLALLMKIQAPSTRLTKSLDMQPALETHAHPPHSPKIAAQYSGTAPVSRRISRGASLLTPAHNADPADSQTHSDLKFPPGFVSSGDLEEDLDRLMELDGQGDNSGASSAAQSPPQSARLSSRSIKLPPLGLSASQAFLPPLSISAPNSLPASKTPLSSSRARFKISPGRDQTTDQSQQPATVSETDTGLGKTLLPGASSQTDTPNTPSLTSARHTPVVADSAMASPGPKVPRLSFASQSSFPDALATSQTRQSSLGTATASTAHRTNTSSQHRQQNPLLKADNLHIQMVQLLLELLLTGSGQLEPAYQPCSHATQQLWPLAVLQRHLSHAENAHLATPLLRWARAHSPAAVLLLRLTCKYLFDDTLYRDRQSIGWGAFARVFKCQLPDFCQHEEPVALKVTDLSEVGEGHDSQATAFREISIMQRLTANPGVCQLHDFGITGDSTTLVMARYKCSLREWRQRQPAQPQHQLRLYLNVFCKIAKLVQELAAEQVVHFDLKCDNVLVEPLPGIDEEAFWAPVSDQLPFQVVLADFGDSCDFHSSDQKFTTRNQGTECVRAPEMLLMSGEAAESDSEGKASQAGAPCDVWALGCLLYELVAGTFLFPSEPDWSKFYITVTDAKQDMFAPDVLATLQPMPVVLDVLDFILVRNPLLRPTAAEVTARYCRPVVLPAHSLRSSTTLPSTPSRPPSDPHTIPTSPLTALQANQLIPVSSQLYLGALGGLSDAQLLQQAAIRYAIVISRADEGLSRGEVGVPNLEDLLQWLLTESSRATALGVCTAGGIPCKMIPVQISKQVDGQMFESQWSLDQLPKLVKHIAQVLADPNTRLVVAASPGCQEYAAAVAVAHAVHNEGLTHYAALVQLQHARHLLKAAHVCKEPS